MRIDTRISVAGFWSSNDSKQTNEGRFATVLTQKAVKSAHVHVVASLPVNFEAYFRHGLKLVFARFSVPDFNVLPT